eukprot:m.151423 g.151423  ORF g.151423 m.151423 type:complete len:392 (-) comp17860_c0_seq1:1058-2233(-)
MGNICVPKKRGLDHGPSCNQDQQPDAHQNVPQFAFKQGDNGQHDYEEVILKPIGQRQSIPQELSPSKAQAQHNNANGIQQPPHLKRLSTASANSVPLESNALYASQSELLSDTHADLSYQLPGASTGACSVHEIISRDQHARVTTEAMEPEVCTVVHTHEGKGDSNRSAETANVYENTTALPALDEDSVQYDTLAHAIDGKGVNTCNVASHSKEDNGSKTYENVTQPSSTLSPYKHLVVTGVTATSGYNTLLPPALPTYQERESTPVLFDTDGYSVALAVPDESNQSAPNAKGYDKLKINRLRFEPGAEPNYENATLRSQTQDERDDFDPYCKMDHTGTSTGPTPYAQVTIAYAGDNIDLNVSDVDKVPALPPKISHDTSVDRSAYVNVHI